MHLKTSFAKWQPFWLRLSVLRTTRKREISWAILDDINWLINAIKKFKIIHNIKKCLISK